MPPPPVHPDNFTDRGDIWGFGSAAYKIAWHWSEFSVNAMDMTHNEGVFWVQDPDTLPYWVHSSPLRTFFHWWMEKNHCQLIHAAAVGTDDGAVLITGKGGVGKSSTALACLDANMNYYADDYVVVGLDPKPRVYTLYSTAKLNGDQVARFARFAPLISNPDKLGQEKAVMFLNETFGRQIKPSAPLRAVLTPNFASRPETRFSPAQRNGLFRATAFTTLAQLPYAGQFTHDFVERLISNVPGWQMHLGHDIASVPDAIKALLANEKHVVDDARGTSRSTNTPKISVVIPVFNGKDFIADAIASVLSQNYPNLEIVVVNDGSTDGTADVVKNLDGPIVYVEQENAGPSAARNAGLKSATGDFIAFLDVDDLWPADNLSAMMDVLIEEPEVDVVHGYGQLLERDEAGNWTFVGNPQESFPFYISAALYRRSAFERIGSFDTELKFSEDTDWFQRAYEADLYVKRLGQITLFVRRHGKNMTHGKSIIEVQALLAAKKAINRRRQAEGKSTNPKARQSR